MSLYKPTIFTGVATALITPFREGSIDYEALEHLIEMQIDAGISALLLAGTTGEGSTLTTSELFDLIRFSRTCIKNRVPLLAGCGSNCTAHAKELVCAACEGGADALLAVTPYYNKTNDEGILLHYHALADAASRPLILYDVPTRTGYAMTLSHYRSLSEHPNIVAIKEASGDLGFLETTCTELGNSLDVYTGNDHQILPSARLGARGVISVYSNIYPRRTVELWKRCTATDAQEAADYRRALLPQMQALFWEVNPIPVKYVASLMGLCRAEYRLPLCPPSADVAKRLRALFEHR